MGARCVVHGSTTPIPLIASDAATLLQVVAGDAGLEVYGFGIYIDGVDGSEPPPKFELVRQSTAGSGSSAAVVAKLNDEDGRTLKTTAIQSCTSEPTGTTVVMNGFVPTRGGGFHRRFDQLERITVGPSDRLGIKLTADSTQSSRNVLPYFLVEE